MKSLCPECFHRKYRIRWSVLFVAVCSAFNDVSFPHTHDLAETEPSVFQISLFPWSLKLPFLAINPYPLCFNLVHGKAQRFLLDRIVQYMHIRFSSYTSFWFPLAVFKKFIWQFLKRQWISSEWYFNGGYISLYYRVFG